MLFNYLNETKSDEVFCQVFVLFTIEGTGRDCCYPLKNTKR